MPSFLQIAHDALRHYLRYERWVIAGLTVVFLLSFGVLSVRFFRQTTLLVPALGGTYIEGSIGEFLPINPWFNVNNDVNRDIGSLIFSGLLRYNPNTKSIEDDLATLSISEDGRTYTLTLRENLFWHDSTIEKPHPVTADDVLFTFETIKDPLFPNSLLHHNFEGVGIELINIRTVQFRLSEPYRFFPSNLTIGLLPRASFEGVPVANLDQALDFGFDPVGAGPYTFKNVTQTELSTEVTLERFSGPQADMYRLERVVFRIFPDYQALLSDIRNLDAIRLVPHTDRGRPLIPKGFVAQNYSLPQYVALFFNLDRKTLQDQKLRLGLQLGTNKQNLVDALGESVIVDTPLLEINTSDWRYQFDPESAQGALFESQWFFPEKVRLQRLLEQRETNTVGAIRTASVVLLDTGAVLTITGSYTPSDFLPRLNGITVTPHPTATGTWVGALATYGGTGSLKLGMNLIKLTTSKDKVIDSFYLWRTSNTADYRRAIEEQKLMEQFVQTRDGTVPDYARITIRDLTLDGEFLRKRTSSDPIGIRINDAGKQLSLTLLTSPSPPNHRKVAELIAEQWRALGVQVTVNVPETRAAFEEKLLQRDYDLLLFGQSLLDNLDSYPYWHSSGVQKITGERTDLRLDAYNLSQYASFEADALLESIRSTPDQSEWEEALGKLREVLKRDVPAIFLYSPQYTFAYRNDLKGVEVGSLSLHSDRFLTLGRWYVKEKRIFPAGKSWLSFFGWLSSFFWQETLMQPVTQSGSTI